MLMTITCLQTNKYCRQNGGTGWDRSTDGIFRLSLIKREYNATNIRGCCKISVASNKHSVIHMKHLSLSHPKGMLHVCFISHN